LVIEYKYLPGEERAAASAAAPSHEDDKAFIGNVMRLLHHVRQKHIDYLQSIQWKSPGKPEEHAQYLPILIQVFQQPHSVDILLAKHAPELRWELAKTFRRRGAPEMLHRWQFHEDPKAASARSTAANHDVLKHFTHEQLYQVPMERLAAVISSRMNQMRGRSTQLQFLQQVLTVEVDVYQMFSYLDLVKDTYDGASNEERTGLIQLVRACVERFTAPAPPGGAQLCLPASVVEEFPISVCNALAINGKPSTFSALLALLPAV